MLALLALAAIGINSFDQKLSPAAAQLLVSPPNTVPKEKNLYLALLGFHAPSGRDPIAYGQLQVDEADRSMETRLRDLDSQSGKPVQGDAGALKFQGDLKDASPTRSSIWSYARTHRAEIADARKQNAELHARYRQLWQMIGYYETVLPNIAAPVAAVDANTRSLYLADVAVRLQSPSAAVRAAAFQELQSDLGLWRTMLRGHGSLISKMLAAIGIQGDLLLLGDMVADPTTDLTMFAGAGISVLEPFPVSDWHIDDAFRTEFRSTYSLFQSLSVAPDFYSEEMPNGINNRLARLFFKLNATTNRQAEVTLRQCDLADADPRRFPELQRSYQDWAGDFQDWVRASSVYNPMGRVLLAIEGANLVAYVPRIYDVATLQRLVRLAFQLRKDGVSPDGVDAYMKAHPEWSTHPVSGTFMDWNPQTQRLGVPVVGKQRSDRRFSLTLALKSHNQTAPVARR